MCHLTPTLHVYDPTDGGGGEVTGENAAKPVTPVQDCVSMFVSVELLEFLISRIISSHVFGGKMYFLPKHDIFLTLTKCFLSLNLTRA